MCEIQWIDEKGIPTPDIKEPIGRVRCRIYNWRMGVKQPWDNESYSRWFTICADHAKLLSRPDMCEWQFEATNV